MEPSQGPAPPGPPQQQVLSLDQVRALRACNDYVERPAEGPGPPFRRSSTAGSSLSRASAASDQRLLAPLPPPPEGGAVRAQPRGAQKAAGVSPGKGAGLGAGHMLLCERCGRCRCRECGAAVPLPSCWACGQRCLCSPESAVEYATCLCLVRGLLYHCCHGDEEDGCSDRPCSCRGPRAAARWVAMTTLALCLPCLCCYPPARLCLALARRAHDRATRPGCRCRQGNTVLRKVSSPSGAPGHAPSGHAPSGHAPGTQKPS